MDKRLCYISRNYRNKTSSGNKAKTDNEATLREMGAVNLGLPTTYYKSKVLTFLLDLFGIVHFVFAVRPDDIILLQYPVKKYFSFVCNVAHLRHAHIIALIHDLGSMRRKRLTVRKEISRLMHADCVIASNGTMRDWLERQGYSHKLGNLQLFDYRSVGKAPIKELTQKPDPFRIVYAGALARRKNTFLMKMETSAEHYQLIICGNRNGLPGLKESEHLKLHGFMSPEDFITSMQGDFGLVWDGDSLDECTGDFGEYLRWNSPHKASFYLRAGLPLIVWSQSALAKIVKQEGVGICINHIGDLNDILPQLTLEEINSMKRNVARVSERLSHGDYFKDALKSSIQTEQEKHDK
ncbi:MAG: galactofuranosyltransferase [Prevotella sp.]|jgi:hypothetical protein